MTPTLTFFSVGNGDMTLIQLENGQTLLIDAKIRASADDPNDETPDVARTLRHRLSRDEKGRLFVDALLLSHPDQDHCTGLEKHFHLGSPHTWSPRTDKILIRELWSSPMVFRRASRRLVLCDDAKAFHREARRRVKCWHQRPGIGIPAPGDRILILGEDEKGKTDDLGPILVKVGQTFSRVNRCRSPMQALLLAPLPPSDDEYDEEIHSKNNSSTILNFTLWAGHNQDACRFLTAGDAEVVIWERLWERHWIHPDWLSYDILLAPHHCSWHSLSHDSWSEERENAKVSTFALNALSRSRSGAVIVASSKVIVDDESDPPCIRAAREYKSIVSRVNGSFVCVGDSDNSSVTVTFEITPMGIRRKRQLREPLGRIAPLAAPTVLVPPKSRQPVISTMAPSRPPIKPWGGQWHQQPRVTVTMSRRLQERLENHVSDLQRRHPALRLLHYTHSDRLLVEGPIGFRGECNSRTVEERYRISLVIPQNYPRSPPLAFETGGRIPSDYEHLMQAGNLCLGTPLEVDLRFALGRTLLRFVEDLVIPYLFGYSYFEQYGEMPFGERCHSPEAYLQSYQEHFGVEAAEATLLLRLLAGGRASKRQLDCYGADVQRLHTLLPRHCFGAEFKHVKEWLAKRGYKTSNGRVVPRQFLRVPGSCRTSRKGRGRV